jgi:hypothetical protein
MILHNMKWFETQLCICIYTNMNEILYTQIYIGYKFIIPYY